MTPKMPDENWLHVREVFDAALRQSAEERSRFVRQACGGDEALLAEIESLLDSFDSAGSFLETPAIAKIADELLPEERRFSNGQILGHYEIIEQIGTGGMGEVYLAKDRKLNRRVALKILRQNLSSDDQAYRRLLREAQAAALLEHPNICQIHEICEIGEHSFIVMQYVEGRTLAEQLADTRPDVERCLELAIQIADALSEAHAHNVIHRDIKPANIIVNEKGQAKILDFGLAKFIETETREDTVKRLNSSGAVMGTVPYMSPEQLCGKHLDPRTDIFSFGALFYEMLTGRQPFARENNAEVISAILKDEPSAAGIPKSVRPILRKCLMKNRAGRYQTAHELADDLRAVRSSGGLLQETVESGREPAADDVSTSRLKRIDPTEGNFNARENERFYFWNSSSAGTGSAARATEPVADSGTVKIKPAQRYNPLIRFSIFLILLIGGALALILLKLDFTDDSRSFDELRPVQLVSWKAAAGSYYTDYRVSNDGKLIAYSSSQDGGKENIFVKQTTDGAEIRVTRDEWVNVSPVWSPDDQRIAYTSIRGTQTGIYVTPSLGGTATPLKIVGPGDVLLRHWSKNGETIFYEYQGNLFRLDLAAQDITQVTDFAAAPGTQRQFSFSPDEDRIAYRDETEGQIDIWVMPAADGGEKRRLTNDRYRESRPRWHADGKRILYNVMRETDSQISLVYADGRAPVRITRGDGDYQFIDIAADGTKIFYFSLEDRSDIVGLNTDSGEEFEVASTRDYENWAEPSPDGKSILFQTKTLKHLEKTHFVVKPLGGGTPALTVEGHNPRWLADSRRISFLRETGPEQRYNLFLVDAASGEEKQITTAGVMTPSYGNFPKNRGEIGVEAFSPDGRKLVYINSKNPKNVWLAALDAGGEIKLTDNENPNVRFISPLFSADGRRVAFVSRETVSDKMIFGLWLWEDGRTKRLFSTEGGLRLVGWSAAGGELLLEVTDGFMVTSPLDVKLVQVALTGESRTLATLKNIYADTVTLSPSRKMLAFTARQNDRDDIFTVPAGGGDEPKKITANSSARLYYANPVWSADGKTIFFDKQEQIDTISMFENFK